MATNPHSQRPTQRGGELSVTTPSLGSPIWWIVSSNQFENQLIVADRRGGHGRAPADNARHPFVARAGAVLRVAGTGRIAAHDAASELGSRFTGTMIGTIGASALPSPDDLVIVEGQSEHTMAEISGASVITSFRNLVE